MRGRRMHRLAIVLSLVGAGLMLWILWSMVVDGVPYLSWHFVTTAPSELAAGGGIGPELVNTLVMVALAMVVSMPLSLAAAIFRVEYGKRPTVLSMMDSYRESFMSMPSVVAGLLVYLVAVRWWGLPMSILTGALALLVINLPFTVTLAEGALARVSQASREASWALGATRYQTIRRVVLPSALAELIESYGLACGRLAGESAALVFTAGVNISRHFSLLGPGETLSLHLWYIRTEGLMPDRNGQAAATGLVLLIMVFLLLWVSRRVASWFIRE